MQEAQIKAIMHANLYQFIAAEISYKKILKRNYVLNNEPTVIDPSAIMRAAELAKLSAVTNTQYILSPSEYNNWANCLLHAGYMEISNIRLFEVLKTARMRYCAEIKAWNEKRTETPPVVQNLPKTVKGNEVFSQIQIEDTSAIDDAVDFSLSDSNTNVFRQCDFCNKETMVHRQNGRILDRLSGDKGFYCTFCLNHDFNTRKSKHVFQLTFRSIIGYLHESGYTGKSPRLYLTQIADLINNHQKIGMMNPVFSYDEETYCWYVDFAKVGRSSKKIPVSEVIRTVNDIISAFNPFEYIKEFKSYKLVQKYEEAILQFYQTRHRPEGKRLCAPTLIQCAADTREVPAQYGHKKDKKMELAAHRDFMPSNLKLSYRR